MSLRIQQLPNRLLMVLGLALVVCAAIVFVVHDRQPSAAATPPAPATGKAGDKVQIKDFLFNPETIDVAVGTKITFTNEDSAPHTATSDADGGFDTGTLKQGDSRSVTLTKAGTFDYVCTIHPFMNATVTVR